MSNNSGDLKMKRAITLVIDGQYGSTGKGAIVGYIASNDQPDTIVTQWAPNAGHTTITKSGQKFIHIQLANGIISPRLKRVLIGPGSLINPEILAAEIHSAKDHGYLINAEVIIHPFAGVVEERHREEEAGPMTKIGSTKKGCGAAQIHRIRRNPDDQNVACKALPKGPWHVATIEEYNKAVDAGRVILGEGSQGFGLSMYHGFYPYTTYRDVTTAQHIADMGLPLSWKFGAFKVVGTFRTYPIRVANRFDEQGVQVGYSGPCYDDQKEISFEDINQATEYTTVTKLPRRIFTFSEKQAADAIRQNGIAEAFLNFCNYCQTEAELMDIIKKLSKHTFIRYYGFGPAEQDIIDVKEDSPGTAMKRIIEMYHAYKGYK